MSREQMADVLNLPVRTILAIEENNPSVLPDAVYVNGYMRSYAKLLGLASQPLIDAWWAQHVENQEQVSIEGHNDEMVEKTVNVRPFKMGRWAVAGLVLSAGFVYFVSNNNQQAANNVSDVQANVEALEKEPLLEPQSTTRDCARNDARGEFGAGQRNAQRNRYRSRGARIDSANIDVTAKGRRPRCFGGCRAGDGRTRGG
jgi:cytoskeletal protein RodZ